MTTQPIDIKALRESTFLCRRLGLTCSFGPDTVDNILYALETAVETLRFYTDGAPFCGYAREGEDATLVNCACGMKHNVGGRRARAALSRLAELGVG